ncbi:MAG: RluA family pseudouridine synthase [Acidobacteria bacterium]|nr:MAG: RluA family pseudouridine synthase [Acidobacteriota bacterium]PYQ80279.1 MAG: RluA family pseudouridine synthase [Acidobacteriota bacterium]PYR06870.1 MAG: RluA family pseudouridine synthase [Acidobacteriota bacterium]
MANRTWTAGPSDAGLRLDKFLADPARLGSRARAAAALQRGKIFVNDRETTTADAGARLARGDTVRVWMDRPGSAKRQTSLGDDRDLPIVYEDEALIVLNKPAGLLAVPLERRGDARSVFEDLKEYLRKRRRPRPLVVHRIDRDTSGLVLFAKNALVHARLKTQFARHLPERIYLAVVYGQPEPSSGTWRDHLVWDQKALIQKETHPRDPRAKQAISRYRVVETLKDASLVEVTLVTGRRNQIRLQARLRGHMLVGEQRYVYGPDSLRTIAFPRQALHAARLALDHPITGRRVSFEAPLPDDLVTLIAKLRRS